MNPFSGLSSFITDNKGEGGGGVELVPPAAKSSPADAIRTAFAQVERERERERERGERERESSGIMLVHSPFYFSLEV